MIGMTYARSEARASLVRDAHPQISEHRERKPAFDNMVQTKAGTRNNPWLEHLRQCAAEYQRRRAVSSEEQSVAANVVSEKPVRRRVVGKKVDTKACAQPKEELPEDTDKPIVKAIGKRRAKKAMNNS